MTTATTALVWLGVALIGGVGSVLRFVIDRAVARRSVPAVPVRHARRKYQWRSASRISRGLALNKEAALLAGTAFVGAYTTFSTWMLETQRLGEERQLRSSLANIVVSVVLGVAAAFIGQRLAELF